MDFHSMKRRDLQALCKKHGIQANLKNIEMANRLASLFKNETEEETKISPEDSIDSEIIVRKEAKKVTFSPENEVFEFTQSVKKGRAKKVRMRSQTCAQDLQQDGVEIRRSTRILAKGISIAGRNENESNTRRISCSDVTDFEEQKTGEYHMKDVQDHPNVDKVSKRSRRLLTDIDVQTNTQERRRSIRVKASDGRSILWTGDAANPFIGGGTSDGRTLSSTKESKGKRKAKQPERPEVVNNQDGERVKDKATEPSKDWKVPRRSKRLGNKLNVLMDKRPVKDVKSDDVEVEKAPKPSKELGKRDSRHLVDGQAKKGEKQSQRTSGNDCKDKKLLQSLKCTALGNMVGQAMSNSPKRCSVLSWEQDRTSVDNLKKPKMNDKMQLSVRSTSNSSRHDSFEAPLEVEGNLIEKKTNETLEKKWDSSAEPEMGMEILSTQSNQTLKRLLDEYAQLEPEEAEGPNVEARGSSKKMKSVNQECIKHKQKGMVEDSPFTSEIKATESDMIAENDLGSVETKDDCCVTKSVEAEAKCWNEIQSIKDDEESSVEKNIQAEDLHAGFSERYTENNKVGCISVGDGHMDSLDEVKDDNLEKLEHTQSCERGCKLNALELSRGSSNDFSSLSPTEKHISKSIGEDERKALSQHLLRNKDSSAFADSAIFTTTERNLLLMEQLSEKGKTPTVDSVAHHNVEAVKSNDVVLTTPKKGCMLGDAGIDEEDEDLTATNFPDESDVINTTERYVKLGGSTQTEARFEDENIVVELQDEPYIATSQERKFGVGIGKNEENRTVELQHEFGTCTSPDGQTVLENYASDEAEKAVHFYEESKLSTGLHRDQPLADSEIGEPRQQQINSADKSSLFTSLDRQVLCGDSEQKKEIKSGEKAAAESKDESVVPKFSERHPFPENLGLDEAAKDGEDKVMELQVDSDIFTSAKKLILLETDEGMEGNNITANTHVVSDVFTASQYRSLMGDSEPEDESNISTILEKHLMSGDYGVDGTKMIKENTTITYEESFVFTSPERRQFLGISEPHNAGKQEQEEVNFKEYQSHHSSSPNFDSNDDYMVLESHVAALDPRENTITDSSSSMPSKVSYNHELNGGQETVGAQLIPKGSQAEDVVGLDGTQGTLNRIRECSPHVDSVNHPGFDIAGKETIIKAESNVSFSSYDLALPAEGKSEIIGESSSYLGVPGTCSVVPEEAIPSIDTQNKIFDALEELAMTDNNEADELIEAKLSNSTGGSTLPGKTCVLAETDDDEQLDFRNTCDKSDRKFLENEATGPIATTFEKAISLIPDEFTVEDNEKEKAADVEIITREATPSPEERDPFSEDLGLDEAAKDEEVKAMQLQVDRDIFTSAEKRLLLETDEGMKGDNITANTHFVSDVCTASNYHSLMGGSEPDEAAKKYRENKKVESLGESNIPTILEKHLLSRDYGIDGTKMIKENTAVTSLVFTSPERRQFLGISESHNAGKQEQEDVDFKEFQSHHSSSPNFDLKEENVVLASHVVALDPRENAVTDSSGIMPSKVSYNHELNAGQETAGAHLIPKGSQAEDVVGLDATQGTPKKITERSPHVDSVNHYDSDTAGKETAGKETVMEAESNVSFSSSYVLVLPAEGKSEIIGESSSYLEVRGTCSMVSEEAIASTDTQNKIFDALEELAMTDNNEADELIEAKLTINIQNGCEGNLLSNSTGGSTLSGKTFVLAETDDEHLDSINICDKSAGKFLENVATGPIATTFEKAISLTADEFTVEDTRKEKAADEEMIVREATPSPEETLNESPENENEYSTIDESVKLSEMQVRREPNLIYRTQVKPDMKENAPHLKTLHNLNLTAPRTSKRQPLQDLGKN